MNKLTIVSLILLIGLASLVIVSLMEEKVTINLDRADLSRLVTHEKLDKDTNIFLWDYWILGIFIQALVTLAAGIGISMLMRGETE